jgi:protein TonB
VFGLSQLRKSDAPAADHGQSAAPAVAEEGSIKGPEPEAPNDQPTRADQDAPLTSSMSEEADEELLQAEDPPREVAVPEPQPAPVVEPAVEKKAPVSDAAPVRVPAPTPLAPAPAASPSPAPVEQPAGQTDPPAE